MKRKLNTDNYLGICGEIGYHIRRHHLLPQVFGIESYSKEEGTESNEDLEFVGGRVLDFYVTKILMDKDADYNPETYWNWLYGNKKYFLDNTYRAEEQIIILKQHFVNKNMLAKRIKELRFDEFLLIEEDDVTKDSQNETSIMAKLFKSILGAVAIDCDYDPEILEDSVRIMLNMDYFLKNGFEADEKDYVKLVRDWCMKEDGVLPNYIYGKNYSTGECDAAITLGCPILFVLCGIGKTKNEAKNDAAKVAYTKLCRHKHSYWSIRQDLPEDRSEINKDTAINLLQELAKKRYFSYPEYRFDEKPTENTDNGIAEWGCRVYFKNINDLGHNLDSATGTEWEYLYTSDVVYAPNKEEAKKQAALIALQYLIKKNLESKERFLYV